MSRRTSINYLKRADGLAQIPWQTGKCMTWDVTGTDTLAVSYIQATSSTAEAATEGAADWKELKYQSIAHTHFHSALFRNAWTINSKGTDLFNQLDRPISACTSDKRETAFLFQRLSLTIQRFNAVSLQWKLLF